VPHAAAIASRKQPRGGGVTALGDLQMNLKSIIAGARRSRLRYCDPLHLDQVRNKFGFPPEMISPPPEKS
jgi:hypothetical protein